MVWWGETWSGKRTHGGATGDDGESTWTHKTSKDDDDDKDDGQDQPKPQEAAPEPAKEGGEGEEDDEDEEKPIHKRLCPFFFKDDEDGGE